jgi:hypothetical protein
MLVDCQTCPVRNVHCADCMVTALSALPIVAPPVDRRSASAHRVGPDDADPLPATVPLDRAERRAVSVLLAAGLVTTATANAARAHVETLPRRREEHAARRAV